MALQLEAGKYYRTRDGRKVGPIYERGGEWMADHKVDEYVPMWNIKSGVANFTSFGPKSDSPEYDIIAEWQDDDTTAHDDAMTLLQNAAIAFIRAGNYSAALEVVTILRDESE